TTSIWGRDPAMDQAKLSEQVPMYMLIIVSLAIAIPVNLLVNYVCPMFIKIRVIAHDFRDFLLSVGQAITLSTFLVNFMKNMTGRFRPCFYAMCDWNYDVVWDGVADLCSDPDGDDEGRKSFPSGHSSFAWSVMGVLTLYLLGRARLTNADQNNSILQEGVRTFKLFFCFLPCLGAAWVAITRSTDNRHHYSDIVAGSVIGAAAACLAYNHNYGSIYSWKVAGLPYQTIHERRQVRRKLHPS
ncbi:Phosphatidic acid phosphatase, partial [Phytophthora megakarya]